MEKLIIFDLDGTVIDTIEDITDAMNKMLVANNFNTITYDAMKKKVGGSSRDIVRLAIDEKISEERLTACEREYTNYYIDGKSPKTRPFNGIKEVFGILKSRGYKIAAISNKPDYEIDALRESVIKPLGFDAVMGLCDQFEPKPNPNGTLYMLKKFGVKKENAYFVGDGETDVLTAKNAGINCIAVLWGNRDREFLRSFGAEVFAENPAQLIDLIK